MKKLTFLQGIMCVVVGMTLMGCGGGGDSDSSSSKVEMTEETVDKLGENAATALPGCEYTSENVATVQKMDMLAYKTVTETIKKEKKELPLTKETINESDVGECGGSYTVTGEHDNGDTDVTYLFDNFCSGSATLNGSAHVYVDGTPSDDGPVTDSIEISTGSSGMTLQATVDGTTTTQSLYLDDAKWTSSGSVTADEIRTTSTEGTFTVSNLDIAYNETAETLQVNNATYSDPEVGDVTIKSSAIPTGDTATGSATLTVTGSDGTATFTSTDVSTGLFTASLPDGTTVGALDCSGLAAEAE